MLNFNFDIGQHNFSEGIHVTTLPILLALIINLFYYIALIFFSVSLTAKPDLKLALKVESSFRK